MKQGTVKFSKEFVTPIGLKEWVGIELEFDMNTEDPKEVLTKAKEAVIGWYTINSIDTGYIATHPAVNTSTVIQVNSSEYSESETTIETIMACSDLKELDTYKFIVKGKEELQNAFNLRENQLIQGMTKEDK